MSSLDQRLETLSPEKRLLLQILRREKQGKAPLREATERPERRPVQPFEMVAEEDRQKLPPDVEDAYPLTTVQLGMLYHMEMSPDGPAPAYHNVNSFHLKVGFDLDAFRQACQVVVARHAQLRTAFDLTSYGEPLQLVFRSATLPVEVEDLRHLSYDEQIRHLQRFLVQENTRLLDLSRPPLLRFHLHRRSDESFQLTLTEPHAISDGWSLTSTMTEIFQHYLALLSGQEPPAPPPPGTSYAEFVRLEREALASEECRSFWAAKLAGCTVSRLPRWPQSMRARAGVGHKPTFYFDAEVQEGVHRLVRSASVPLKSVLFAIHVKVMSMLSGQDEVITGLTTHGRPEEEGGDRIRGLFLNTVPFRYRLPDGNWTDLVKGVFEAELELWPYRRYPLAAAQRLAGGQTLFESVFSYLHFHSVQELVDSRGVEFLPGSADWSVTHFPLAATFLLNPGDSSLQLTLEHNDTTLCSQQMAWIQTYFRNVLHAVATNPAGWIHAGPFLAPEEQRQLLEEWNPRPAAPLPVRCLHQGFEAQADRRPGAPAVRLGDDEVTYGDLERSANRLASHLRQLGVRPGTLVGICLERSLEMVVAILGVLKAGGAYVPLDPDYPEARLAFILADADLGFLVTTEPLRQRLPGDGTVTVLLDADAERIAEHGGERLDSGVDPGAPAYVIYTSGSTGQPKGVVVHHANAARLFAATDPWFGFGDEDVWTFFHSYAFDFSVWEIWGALLYGGRLVIVPYMVSRSPESFLELLRRERVTVLNQTPSAFRQLVQADEATGGEDRLALRTVVFGGEALDFHGLRPWLVRHGDTSPRLINMYGITETTVHVTYRPVVAEDLEAAEGSLLGRPIPDLQVCLLDVHQQPVPVGVAGEICVGGAGVAAGYLGRPELTAQRFVPRPFGDKPGARLYRSGDLARYLPNGDLEYLGRLDHQVKIRGFRIELGEIEAALAQHPGVRQGVVIAREDTPGEVRLVAYVVPMVEGSPSGAELRAFLSERLPSHEMPAAIMMLAELPLTAHGKLDRKVLPVPDASRPELEEAFMPPRTPVEQKLAEVWQQVLGIERVGVRDDFFALGGDSIRSIQVVARSRDRGIALSVPQLYRYTTVEKLASALQEEGEAPAAGGRTRPFELVSEEDRQRLPEDVVDAYPLTRLQAGMLFHMDLVREAPLYQNVESFHLQARFELEPFRAAVQRVVERHPILRTSFHLGSYSEPLQLVHQEALLPIEVEDLRLFSRGEQERLIDSHIEWARRHPFDLAQAPQLRFHIHLRGDETFQLTFTENHAIFDGWSLYSTLTEIFRHYSALLRGESLPVEPPTLPFRDFVAAEREALRSPEARAFWLSWLEDAPFVEVPRWSRPAEPGPGGRNVHTLNPPIPRHLSDELQRVAVRARLPLKSVLMACHIKVLSRLTSQDDILTGMVANGRAEEEGGEQTRGLFLNTLPFRVRLPEGSWMDLARAVFEAEQAMLPFRRYPLADLQNELAKRALFETSFNYTHFHVVQGIVQSQEVVVLDFRKSTETNFTLSAGFTLDPATQQLMLEVAGGASQLPLEQVDAISSLFLRALEAVVSDPAAAHRPATLLSTAELQQVLGDWNDTARDLLLPELSGLPPCLHELVQRRALSDPGRVAVESEDGSLSYGDLESRATHLARVLTDLGTGPEGRVAVCLDRSLEMIVALLAIWKAGAAYVPLDPGHPFERLQTLLEDIRPDLVLTQRALAHRLPLGVSCLSVEDLESFAPRATALPEADPDALAYVIYTSGSTGRPKGVMIPHRAICNRVVWMLRAFSLAADDSVLQKTPYTFDASIWEMFLPLIAGARLVMARPQGHLDSAYLAAAIAEREVTILQMVPSLLRPLLEEPGFRACRSLRRVFCGGEELAGDLARSLFALLDVELHNLYGPTEAAIDVTSLPCPRGFEGRAVPIGKPLPNVKVFVVDPRFVPVPLGSPGELVISGVNLARGYFGRPELTAEKFCPDPLSALPGGRLYLTGDLARWLPDGTIEYLGRIDRQVKVRGVRIELREIEALLAEHPAVLQAVVTVRGTAGEDRICAYVVPGRSGEHATADAERPGLSAVELRAFLQQKLPAYMVPAVIVPLPSLPTTSSGKVDLRALPEPQSEPAAGELVEPRTPVEQLVATIWAEVLGLEKVGARDSFFELGGHSLLATRVISRVRELFRIDLPMARIFEHPILEGLAEAIETELRHRESVDFPPLRPVPRDQPLPLSFAQQRLWFLDRLQPGSTAYNIPFFLRIQGALSIAALERSLDEIVRRHESLRTTFEQVGGQPVQRIRPPHLPLPWIDLRALPQAARDVEVLRRALREAASPFDLERGPLLRVRLLLLAEDEHAVLFTLHHIAGDGWSMGLLVSEFVGLYEAFFEGRPSPLPELPIQYADFAHWQRQWLQGEILERQLAYWRERLAGSQPPAELPADGARPKGRAHRAGQQAWDLPPELARGLEELSRHHFVTPFMTLLAAFSVLFSYLSGREDVVVGTDIANRHHLGTEGLIGFFVNQLVLRADVSAGFTFEELLGQVRETTLGAYAHQDLPFERLVEELQPDRDPDRSPLFQAKLVLQNTPAGALELPVLAISPISIPSRSAPKFDLLLNAALTDQGFTGTVEYSADLFEAESVTRFLDLLQLVLSHGISHPETRVEDLFAILRDEDARRRELKQQEARKSTLERLKSTRRRGVPSPVLEPVPEGHGAEGPQES